MFIVAQRCFLPYIPQFENTIDWPCYNLMLVNPLTSDQTRSFPHWPNAWTVDHAPTLQHSISSCSHQHSLLFMKSGIPNSSPMACQCKQIHEIFIPNFDGPIMRASGDKLVFGWHSHCIDGFFMAHNSIKGWMNFYNLIWSFAKRP